MQRPGLVPGSPRDHVASLATKPRNASNDRLATGSTRRTPRRCFGTMFIKVLASSQGLPRQKDPKFRISCLRGCKPLRRTPLELQVEARFEERIACAHNAVPGSGCPTPSLPTATRGRHEQRRSGPRDVGLLEAVVSQRPDPREHVILVESGHLELNLNDLLEIPIALTPGSRYFFSTAPARRSFSAASTNTTPSNPKSVVICLRTPLRDTTGTPPGRAVTTQARPLRAAWLSQIRSARGPLYIPMAWHESASEQGFLRRCALHDSTESSLQRASTAGFERAVAVATSSCGRP
jgi:hypothetical protein